MRRRTLGAAALAAILILSACGGSSPGHGTHSTSTPTSTPTASTPLTVSTATQGGVPPVPGGASLSPGGPVPVGAKATSVTFVSPTTAFVLGTAPCDAQPCSAILRTTDRGAHWVGLPAPRESVSYYLGDGLWGLRFADSQHGYAFGQGLWETSNTGRSWQRARPPGPTVLSLEAVQDRELIALAQSCRPGVSCARRTDLYHEPIGGSWSRVASVTSYSATASIAVHRAQVWVVAGNRLYHSADGGLAFSREAQPCPQHGPNSGQPTSITDNGAHIYLLCTGQGFTGHTLKYVYGTSAAGARWRLVGKPPSSGDGGQIASGSDGAIVIATYSAATLMYRSTNGGRTWRIVLTEPDGGAGWSDLGFTTPSDAVVVHGPAVQDGGDSRPGQVLLSQDGGRTWRPAAF